ncbi:uncharacterized protein LOC109948520 [Prunus persica]|uniref:uncharacterized protein LOC109948520 n=1 Tax=Prunus persica TaxID=3760 RepID=UPI0009AB61CE|nr:uncharacterized protein LOC109948520 [Prunus persica]
MSGTSNNSIKHYVHSIYDHQVFSTEQGRFPKMQKSGWAPINLCEEEERSVILPYYDPLIIHADNSNFDIGRILVDTGSSVSMMFANAFNELQVPTHLFDRSITPFVSFSSDVVQLIGSIHLPISIGSAQQRATVTTLFLIVDCPTTYNVILRRLALAQMKIFISTQMLLLKFPTPYGTGMVRGDQLGAQSCYASAVKSTKHQHKSETLAVTKAPALPQAGSEPPEDPREESKCHAYDPERYEAMKREVDKLSSIGFIKEVDYPTWLANLVMVRKPKKGWRMCIDCTNLNRACPKDSIPLPRIDQLVDATAGHALLSFMDVTLSITRSSCILMTKPTSPSLLIVVYTATRRCPSGSSTPGLLLNVL